jgi:hypothetical protein
MPDDLKTPLPPDNEPGHHPDVEQDKPRLAKTGRKATEAARHVFGFDFDDLYRWADRPLGIGPDSASVEVDADRVVARFGRWTAEIDRSNIVGAEVTGPYNVIKTIGPPHLSLADRGVTFATNRRQGVCIRLARPIKAMEPTGLLRHPSITVTVERPEELAELLT